MADTKSFSKSELIKKGWAITRANWMFLLKVAVIYVFVSVLFGAISSSFKNQAEVSLLASILKTIVTTVLEIGIIKIGLDIVDGKKPEIRDLYQNYSRFFEFFLTSLMVGIMIVVGFILLVVPGIYIAIKYQFMPFLIVDKKLAYRAAIKEAGKLTSGRWISIFTFDLALIGLNLLGILALGIGLLVTVPVSMFASLYLYRRIS